MMASPNDQTPDEGDRRAGKRLNYDLEERTAKFGEAAIEFCLSVHQTSVSRPLISQAVRAATSVGANYCEADDAVSRKEFMNKIATCKKEAKETRHWLRMLVKASPSHRQKAVPLWKEATELVFAAIHRRR